jgi:hypothetical protein
VVTYGTALHGVDLCRSGEWKQGLIVLGEAAQTQLLDRRVRALTYSYLGYGLARFQKQKREGLKLCREAARMELCEPEVLLNLVRIQLLVDDRRGAVRSVERGLKLHPDHPVLIHYRRQMGIRRRPVVPFLGRSNLFNRILGQLRAGMLKASGRSPATEQND